MTIFSLYFPILLSLSLSFLLHTFKKHIHSFLLGLATTFDTTINTTSIIATNNYNGFVDDVGGKVDGLMSCTESLGFESIDERRVDDEIAETETGDNDNDNNDEDEDEDEDDGWRRMRVAEGRGNWRDVKSFPPPLSSLNRNGQPSFILLPARKNGRLQLSRVRIKRPEILHASRQDGRLRLYLVPDQCVPDDVQKKECEGEEEELQELVEDVAKEQREEIIVELAEEEEEEEEDDEVDEEKKYEKEEDRVEEWKFRTGSGNEGFKRRHEVMNQCHHVRGSHHHHHLHLRMYGVSIA